MRAATLALALLLLGAGGVEAPLVYRFEAVKSKVVVTRGEAERRAAAGDEAQGGDAVRTGWRGRATVAVPERAARFEIFPSTRARLAGTEPGVLIELEKGRLGAIFDTFMGHMERLVATPGAVLAVRGTRYGVEVDRKGEAVLAVFEGTVEVRSRVRAEHAVQVRAGQMCTFSPRRGPVTAPLPPGVNQQTWEQRGTRFDGTGTSQGPGGMQGPGTGGPGGGPGGSSPPRPPGGGSGGRPGGGGG